MEIKDLKSSILKNEVPSLVIFKTEEPILAKEFIKKMSTTLNKYYKYYNKLDEVLYEIDTNLKDDYLYIVLNDYSILSKSQEYLDALSKVKNRNIVLYFDELDTTSSFYKLAKDRVVYFKHLSKPTLVAYAQTALKKNKIVITQERIEKLVDVCNCNYSILCNELDKIIALDQPTSNILLDYMLENGFPDYRQTNMFQFIKEVLKGNSEVFDLKNRLNDSTITFLLNLFRQSKNRLEATGDRKYANIMQLCSGLDGAIREGTINSDYILDYVLLKAV